MKHDVLPLVVDLDGTLIKTDVLMESFLGLMKINPLYIFMVIFWISKGRAVLKSEIASRVDLDVALLPYNTALLEYIRAQRAQGRIIALATGSHRKYADQVASHLGLFDRVFATEEGVNIIADVKADVLCHAYGEYKFAYAGNSKQDLSVWQKSGRSIVIAGSGRLLRNAKKLAPLERHFRVSQPPIKAYFEACRLHQWIKNALIFIPIFSAHRLVELDLIVNGVLAFCAFSLCASSVYLLNDLLDLESDRHHKTKRLRPFAAGTLTAHHGVVLIPTLLLLVVFLTLLLPFEFGVVLLLYYIATTSYSFALKKYIMLDVMVLSGLYIIRIIAGAAATGILLSQWLLAFSMFIFLSLALVKRYSELVALRAEGNNLQVKGRGYEEDDIALLPSLGGASGYLSVLVLALYISSDFVQSMYPNEQILWGICPLMLYWISRVWVIAHRGRMTDDPVVFAIKDPVSLYTILMIGAIFILAGL